MEYLINNVFPSPIYMTERRSNIDSVEEKEIEGILNNRISNTIDPSWQEPDETVEGMHNSMNNVRSNDGYIFNTKLKKIKKFCEEHIKIYVKQIISPREKLDFYITQSWLNVTKPGQSHHRHWHSNSIISGVFYVSTVEDDKFTLYDSNTNLKNRIKFANDEHNPWNSSSWFYPVKDNTLLLFPSWLEHGVEPNENATTDRISISFNTFVKGIFGDKEASHELIL